MPERHPRMLDTEQQIRVWKQGYAVGEDDCNTDACPYPAISPLADVWIAGWTKGRRDLNSSRIEWSDDPWDEDYHPDDDPFTRMAIHFDAYRERGHTPRVVIVCRECKHDIAFIDDGDANDQRVNRILGDHIRAFHPHLECVCSAFAKSRLDQ